MRRFILPALTAVALGSAALTSSDAVASSTTCPPGHFQIGGGSAGWVGCAPMDGGVGEGAGNAALNRDTGIELPELSTYDPEAWEDFFQHMHQDSLATHRELIVRRGGPRAGELFDDLAAGVWVVGRGRTATGEICAATYWTLYGGVVLSDWTGDDAGTALMFFGRKIPAPRSVQRIRVSLTQSGETQSVEAFQSRFTTIRGMGMIMLRVPSTQALLDSVENRQDFALSNAEGELVSGEWNDADEMLPDLRRCIDERDRPSPRS